ncbi:MAG: menaquinone reductase multiheme cytochrome c subunit QrcA [Desulfonauticus sp.]|nr:menaquinone reductase multiheme cytochrome c subunit QrcA [Desulfonauticus sp.]
MKVAKGKSCLVLPFLFGLVGALIVGWWLFPELLYSKKTQPIRFSHKVHVEDQGMSCDECHSYREDGSFAGIPTTEQCAECHSEVQGDDPAEKKFVEEYVEKGKEVPWLIYQKQPDNVFFSHIAHKGIKCTTCHPDVGHMDTPPVYYEDRISGYSKQTMKMWQCERCHARRGASNACYVCHK